MHEIRYVVRYRNQLTHAIQAHQRHHHKRRLVAMVAVAVLGAAIAAAGTVAALRPAPPTKGTIDSLREGYRGYERLPLEPNPGSIKEKAIEIVESPSGPYLLQVAVGTNAKGGKRALFTLFEVDPDAAEWRPVEGIELDLKGVASYVQDVPDAGAFLAYVGAPAEADMDYLTDSGEWKPLDARGPAGFVALPGDSADPPQVRVHQVPSAPSGHEGTAPLGHSERREG